jgi:hypothetical protein
MRETIEQNQAALDYYALMTDRPRVVLRAPPEAKQRAPRQASGNPTEAQVLKAVLQFLKRHPRVAFAYRQNSGTFQERNRDGTTRYVRANTQRGMTDIGGAMKDGRALFVEVKSATGRVQSHQQEFLDQVRAAGGVAGVVRCVEDAVALLGGI